MNTDDLKKSAQEAKAAARDFVNSPQVQSVIEKGKEAVEKGKEWINGPEGQKYIQKGKDAISDTKDKLEDFVEKKTDGKGILGFGATKK